MTIHTFMREKSRNWKNIDDSYFFTRIIDKLLHKLGYLSGSIDDIFAREKTKEFWKYLAISG